MATHALFHGLFVTGFVGLMSVRFVFGRIARRMRGDVKFRESERNQVVRGIFGMTMMGVVVVYLFSPSWFAWAAVPLPAFVRWVGAALLYSSIPLLAWVHWSLGPNFASTLHVREAHALVMHGPYRWVRHPMYSVLCMALLGILLLTANVLIGAPLLLGFCVVVATRRRREEALMLEVFGEDYRDYMLRTGPFLPRLPGSKTAGTKTA